MVLYDHKPYERHFFEAALQALNRESGSKKPVRVKYIDAKLSLDTVHYANGAKIVCIFVNDNAGSEVLRELRVKNVEMVALRCAGFNNCDLSACKDFGISTARVPAYSPYAVAEHCAALLLVINRKIHLAYNRVRTGNFSLNHLVGFDIHGKTVGVIGTGKIGCCFIQIMLGFGCNIVCYDMHPNPELVANPNVRYVENMDDLLRASNILSIHCPLLANKHMINKDSIALMPKGAIIINTSRGGLIKTVDLIDALKTGHIGGAGLDVYEDEQTYFFEDKSGELLCDDILARLLSFQNVVVTSHQAFLTEEALTAIADVTMQNVKEFLFEGKKMKALSNTVNID
ncbi:putative D-lactate dehydrogenase [Cladochytrium replicatum]|nr:putative D-lactate dehydrogenase [Cladochytrium replicatum]